jgi:hypothetical protein
MARDSSTREYLLFIATALSLRWLGSHRKLTFSVVPSYSGRSEEWGHLERISLATVRKEGGPLQQKPTPCWVC